MDWGIVFAISTILRAPVHHVLCDQAVVGVDAGFWETGGAGGGHPGCSGGLRGEDVVEAEPGTGVMGKEGEP